MSDDTPPLPLPDDSTQPDDLPKLIRLIDDVIHNTFSTNLPTPSPYGFISSYGTILNKNLNHNKSTIDLSGSLKTTNGGCAKNDCFIYSLLALIVPHFLDYNMDVRCAIANLIRRESTILTGLYTDGTSENNEIKGTSEISDRIIFALANKYKFNVMLIREGDKLLISTNNIIENCDYYVFLHTGARPPNGHFEAIMFRKSFADAEQSEQSIYDLYNTHINYTDGKHLYDANNTNVDISCLVSRTNIDAGGLLLYENDGTTVVGQIIDRHVRENTTECDAIVIKKSNGTI